MNLKSLNTAETITLVRVIGFPLILVLIYLNDRTLTAWAYILLFSSDFIDGFFAFFFDQESTRRAKLDTLGDILLLSAGVLGFYYFEEKFFMDHLGPIIIVLSLYLLQFFIALIKWGQASSFHTYSAKLTAIVQVVFLSLTLMFEPSTLIFYIAVISSILDAAEDIMLTLLLPRWKANIKGIFWHKSLKNSSGNSA